MSDGRLVAGWVVSALPQLRRVARALTGDGPAGDEILSRTLKQLKVEPERIEAKDSHECFVWLLKSLVQAWLLHPTSRSNGQPVSSDLYQLDKILQSYPNRVRCAYVLLHLERLSTADVAEIMQEGGATVEALTAQF